MWCGDRNFCTAKFLFTIASKKAFFVIRQHGGLGFRELSGLKPRGETETGKLFEQEIEIDYEGETLLFRRVLLKLFVPTRDKEWEISILTNLPFDDADAAKIAVLYRNRWSLETLFQTVTENFNIKVAEEPGIFYSRHYRLKKLEYNILTTFEQNFQKTTPKPKKNRQSRLEIFIFLFLGV